jgi:hypothetical protein
VKLITRKTQKAIRKNLKRAIKQHGPAIAAGLVGGIASTLATLSSNDEFVGDAKARLNKLSDKVQAITNGRDSRKGRTGKSAAVRKANKPFPAGVRKDELPDSRG